MTTKSKAKAIRKVLKETTEVHSPVILAAIQAATSKLDKEKITSEEFSVEFYNKVVQKQLEIFAHDLIAKLKEASNESVIITR